MKRNPTVLGQPGTGKVSPPMSGVLRQLLLSGGGLFLVAKPEGPKTPRRRGQRKIPPTAKEHER